MINTILAILYLAAWAFYTVRFTKRSTHMLQQNSYKNERFWGWIKSHASRAFPIRNTIGLVAVVPFLFGAEALGLIIGFLYFLFMALTMPKLKEKKALVVTARVKRLFITIGILFALFTAAGLLLGNTALFYTYGWLVFLTVIATILTYFITMGANYINYPMERKISQHYVNDAERIIKSMPDLEVIGITGSYGKTSTKHMLETVLSSEFNTLMTPESYNTPMGVTKTIRTMLKPYHEIFIAEMGAKRPGDIEEICDIVHQRYGVLTAVGEQHLETFKTLDNIKKTKFEIVETLPQEGTAFVNKDDENIMSYEQQNQCRTIYYGIDAEDLHYRAKNIGYSSKGTTFTVVKYDGTTAEIQTKLLGRHNIYNILAAVAIGSEKGISFEKIARALRKAQPVEHRLELKKTNGNITIVDDSFNSNPVGSKMAMEVLSHMPEYKIVITPGMVELGEKEYELNKALGTYMADACDFIILVGKKQTVPLQDGLKEKNYPEEQLYVASDLQDALAKMNEIATEPSVVLLENDLPDSFNE